MKSIVDYLKKHQQQYFKIEVDISDLELAENKIKQIHENQKKWNKEWEQQSQSWHETIRHIELEKNNKIQELMRQFQQDKVPQRAVAKKWAEDVKKIKRLSPNPEEEEQLLVALREKYKHHQTIMENMDAKLYEVKKKNFLHHHQMMMKEREKDLQDENVDMGSWVFQMKKHQQTLSQELSLYPEVFKRVSKEWEGLLEQGKQNFYDQKKKQLETDINSQLKELEERIQKVFQNQQASSDMQSLVRDRIGYEKKIELLKNFLQQEFDLSIAAEHEFMQQLLRMKQEFEMGLTQTQQSLQQLRLTKTQELYMKKWEFKQFDDMAYAFKQEQQKNEEWENNYQSTDDLSLKSRIEQTKNAYENHLYLEAKQAMNELVQRYKEKEEQSFKGILSWYEQLEQEIFDRGKQLWGMQKQSISSFGEKLQHVVGQDSDKVEEAGFENGTIYMKAFAKACKNLQDKGILSELFTSLPNNNSSIFELEKKIIKDSQNLYRTIYGR